MEKHSEINLRQYTAKKVSRKYILRILFYVVLLGTVAYMVYSILGKKERENMKDVKEIRDVRLEEMGT